MGELRPERRVDKNGRTVVRHVRPVNGTPGRSKDIPLVFNLKASDFVLSGSQLAMDTVIESILDSSLSKALKHAEREELRSGLKPETAERIDRAHFDNSVLINAARACVSVRDFTLLDNMGVLAERFERQPGNFDRYCAGLARYTGIFSEQCDLTGADAGKEDAAVALIRATLLLSATHHVGSITHKEQGANYLESEALAKLVSERPHQTDLIAHVLIERSLPAETEEEVSSLAAFIDTSETPALFSGQL